MSAGTRAAARPQVLLVTAHPDDETLFAATAHRIVHRLGGAVDLCVVTDGESGARYAALAGEYYGLPLDEPRHARALLPRVRRQELRTAARVIGLRRCIRLGEPDAGYGLDLAPGASAWNTRRVRARLRATLAANRYDFVFVMLPLPASHRDHKLACLLALEVVDAMPRRRPAVLGASLHTGAPDVAARWSEGFPIVPIEQDFRGLEGYALTSIAHDVPVFVRDLDAPLAPESALTYRIVHNWVIAAHRSQGKMQLRVNAADQEQYRVFGINSPAEIARCRRLFDALDAAQN